MRRARRTPRPLTLALRTPVVLAALAVPAATLTPLATAQAQPHTGPTAGSRACPPAALALGYSDRLDKAVRDGVEVGGLSDLAYDPQAGSYVATVDNHDSDPARLWYLGPDLAHPRLVRDPLVLTRPDGTAYDGTTADDEGLAVLPDGRYLVSSETEPSIRVFGRDGREQARLPVPGRFAVSPAGQATANATLEGLTISPSGTTVVAAMEGALSGDVTADGDATYHRFLVYRATPAGTFRLDRQIGYRTGSGMRVPEVAFYRENALLVEEAAYSPQTGNTVDLYAVRGLSRAQDVSGIANLSSAPRSALVDRKPIADLVACPTLGATAKQPQANPLLDNYEGMTVTAADPDTGAYQVALISDDNFNPTQVTRVLNLSAHLP